MKVFYSKPIFDIRVNVWLINFSVRLVIAMCQHVKYVTFDSQYFCSPVCKAKSSPPPSNMQGAQKTLMSNKTSLNFHSKKNSTSELYQFFC